MFDKLIDFLISLWDQILPFETIDHYNRGARLRFGKKVRELGVGFHWRWPFVNTTILILVVPKTMKLSEQSVRTKDGVSVVCKAAIKYDISDTLKAALDVNDPVDAIADMTQGIIRRLIISTEWKDCNDLALENEVAKKARAEAKKWGINVIEVTFTDLDTITSYRLLNSRSTDENYL